MTDLEQILVWINSSDFTAEQKAFCLESFKAKEKVDALKDFQIKRQKENLKINTRFLNKAVLDLEHNVRLLKESNNQLTNFAKIASHDLKSPLRSIASFSSLLNKMLVGKLNDKEINYFNIIESSSKSMHALIDDLLLFTKINSENLNIKEESLKELYEEVRTGLDYDIRHNKVELVCNFKHTMIYCDAVKFKQVLQNLISNSIKFSTFSGNEPKIVLTLSEKEEEWVFSVSDNGIGISEEYKQEVFSEFKKLNGGAFDGTGMGLTIVRKIINKHKGDIWVDQKKERGTKMMFTISKNLKTIN